MVRFRTVPAVLRRVQVWQMPIRHPFCGVRPADSACSSSERPSSVTSIPVFENVIRPPDGFADGSKTGGTKLSVYTFSQCC